jgi:hypothetical protein
MTLDEKCSRAIPCSKFSRYGESNGACANYLFLVSLSAREAKCTPGAQGLDTYNMGEISVLQT